MATEEIVLERDGGVLWVTLNRPQKKNALTHQMIDTLTSVFTDASKNDSDRVVVVKGSGGAFCGGIDLLQNPPGANAGESLSHMRHLHAMANALHELHKPTMSVVEGVAVGAGMGLALGCDLVVASETAKFSTMFTNRALSPDTGISWLLVRLVGAARAKELCYFAEFITAESAHEYGICNRVVAKSDLFDYAEEWAKRLADGPALALSTTKTLIDGAWAASFSQALENEASAQVANILGDDVAEAVTAFFEGRSPRYVRKTRRSDG
jgi:2-(1,2-epoxy-1,2-dihydrophenyl)acetyl-CoA isomerase